MIQQETIPINFAKGLDTKTDPKQVRIGSFLSLINSVFTKAGLLNKRNGFGPLASLSTSGSVFLTTFNENLTAIGTTLQAYVEGSQSWVDKGTIQPITLSVLPTVRSSLSQVQCDSAVAPNGLVCTVFTESNNGTLAYKYVVSDSSTGQNVVNQTAIPVSSGAVTGSPRVFILGGYFLIVFTNTISGVHHLQYIAVSASNPTTVIANTDLAASYVPTNALSWDGIVVGQNFYFAYYSTSGGNSVKVNFLEASFALGTAVTFAHVATIVSVTSNPFLAGTPIIVSFYDSASSTGYSVAVDATLQTVMTATQFISSGTVYSITSSGQGNGVTIIYEVSNQYSYDSSLVSNFIDSVRIALPATVTTGTVGSTATIRSVGLASKSFVLNELVYVLTEYASALQSTYFLMTIQPNVAALNGNILARFAYENGGASLVTSNGYLPYGLPSAQLTGSTVQIAYLFKDLIESQNTQGLVQSIGPAGASNIYSQTGVNLVSLNFDSETLYSSEIGNNLNISCGMLLSYDGAILNEQNFNVFPDNVELSASTSGGFITAQQYYYQVTYEWTDAQGNIFRSAPSVPVTVTTTGSTSSVTVNIPTLRLSYKTGVKIQIYRWSAAQEVYYQVTSIIAPTLNNPAADSIAYVDTLADSSILGNNIIYTTGGVIEDLAGPASIASTLFDDRLWLIDAEDPNVLWYSKQVIEATPVEMSDVFTFYVAPTTGAQGSTGPMTCLGPLDSSLIIFKKDAIYYIQGTGPDNTGANNAYTQPIYVTSTVGCANQKSIVVMNDGLMFQSDKGIWLLNHGFGIEYIGAPVEEFNSSTVTSAAVIPGTTQVRFTLDSGEILMYDYYYQQWGVFEGFPATSSTLYQGLHTLLSASGLVAQETPGAYLDNGNPVLMSFLTGHIQLAGISGYQRIYEVQLLGSYITPHMLQVQFGYDFAGLSEQAVIDPINFTGVYGSDSLYGQTSPYGGPGSLEQWRIQPATQKCQTFQFALQEIYDPSFAFPAGAGFTLSAMTCTIGVNRSYRPVKAATTIGTG